MHTTAADLAGNALFPTEQRPDVEFVTPAGVPVDGSLRLTRNAMTGKLPRMAGWWFARPQVAAR